MDDNWSDNYILALEARLAAVIALCGEHEAWHNSYIWTSSIRAAATGEQA